VLTALLFGLVASSALVIGAVAGAYWSPPTHLVAVALAFASGALITALAFDLFEESFKKGGAWLSAIGLLVGAAAFVVADTALDRYIDGSGSNVSAFALLAGVTLDGIPENMAMGVSLLETSAAGALTLLVAIFASNLPEALGGGDARARSLAELRHRRMGCHGGLAGRGGGGWKRRSLRRQREPTGDFALFRRWCGPSFPC
jgi:ZIP family zinc transporter